MEKRNPIADPLRLFEALNAAAFSVTLCVLFFMTVYLWRQAQTSEVGGWRNIWRGMTSAMALVAAASVFVFGESARSGLVWFWRRFFGDLPFGPMQQGGLIVAIAIIVAGGLLMIRAATRPIFGNWPWIGSAVFVVCFTALFTATGR